MYCVVQTILLNESMRRFETMIRSRPRPNERAIVSESQTRMIVVKVFGYLKKERLLLLRE